MVRDQGQRERSRWSGRREAHSPAPRCSSERHGRAVPARPIRSCPRSSSPSTHREYHVTALPPARYSATPAPEDAQQAQERRLGAAPNQRRLVAADPVRKPHPDLLGGEESAISNWRCWKRRWRQSFRPSIGGEGRRSRPEWPGGGGGDPDRQRARG
jgi:hypothetical protein